MPHNAVDFGNNEKEILQKSEVSYVQSCRDLRSLPASDDRRDLRVFRRRIGLLRVRASVARTFARHDVVLRRHLFSRYLFYRMVSQR